MAADGVTVRQTKLGTGGEDRERQKQYLIEEDIRK